MKIRIGWKDGGSKDRDRLSSYDFWLGGKDRKKSKLKLKTISPYKFVLPTKLYQFSSFSCCDALEGLLVLREFQSGIEHTTKIHKFYLSFIFPVAFSDAHAFNAFILSDKSSPSVRASCAERVKASAACDTSLRFQTWGGGHNSRYTPEV